MTVGELIKVLGPEVDVFIKPNGNKTYFEGNSDDVHEIFLDATIRELSGQPVPNFPENNRKYYVRYGMWVDNIKFFDKVIESGADLLYWSKTKKDMELFLKSVCEDAENIKHSECFAQQADECGYWTIVEKYRKLKEKPCEAFEKSLVDTANFDAFLNLEEAEEIKPLKKETMHWERSKTNTESAKSFDDEAEKIFANGFGKVEEIFEQDLKDFKNDLAALYALYSVYSNSPNGRKRCLETFEEIGKHRFFSSKKFYAEERIVKQYMKEHGYKSTGTEWHPVWEKDTDDSERKDDNGKEKSFGDFLKEDSVLALIRDDSETILKPNIF